MSLMSIAFATVLLVAGCTTAILGNHPPQSLPEGPGLAAKHPGDMGIEADPLVVFAENFELPTFEAVAKRWEDVSHPELMSLSDDKPAPSGGKRSLLVRHVGGETVGGHLYRRLQPGYDRLFVRFYVKFADDCFPIHHFFHVGGYNPSTSWAQGGAGVRPSGDERFSVGLEPFEEKPAGSSRTHSLPS